MSRKKSCEAPRASCGTASGWRVGGRCWRCRAAHNADLRHQRTITDSQRAAFLNGLNRGQSADAAAAAAGVSLARIQQRAGWDGELRVALDGKPLAAQKAAHLGDYLAALTRSGGEVELACRVAGVKYKTVELYRKQEPGFAMAEAAILAWLKEASARRILPLSDEQLDRAAQLLERGASIVQAAEDIGTSAVALRRAAKRHERLAAALPPPKNRGVKVKTPQKLEQLKALWSDLSLTAEEIGGLLGVSGVTAAKWAADLDLPPRRQTDTYRHRRRLPEAGA